ncbi:MAG: GntR family transcriptional regulator [Clostridia bacterium]|jgi:DNA-binding GntR family transcriptional regulator|nr:GntR family transcriptional regulator [Clostridia bacterium]MBQ4453321.1 GntR family transcriptional regulator [Clostridia bacterium]MBQ5956588.1 GntR family transcriptional regulator [Clostridia bacterium]MBR0438117.1 GntR family transcriptional regulator [Clostridia bacterium]MBR3564665.1 GntR family transcriptional regulator [Clostridia bacterium]
MTVLRDHRTVSIADQIFEQLEKEILSGKYQRGEITSELKLSQELGVSRTPVREALRRLEQEHIIKDNGRGIEIIGISREDMLDMYDIRIQLEGIAAARAAEHVTDEQLKEMQDTLELQRFYIERTGTTGEYADDIKDMDSRFHELVYESCGSMAYCDTLLAMHRKMTKFRKASLSKKSRATQSYQEHIAILEALMAHEPELARSRMTQHVINARDNIKGIQE